jgi:hypothetical protein
MRKNGCADAPQKNWLERLSHFMKSSSLVQCGKDASHESLDLRGKRCRECGCGLLKKCPDCATFVSYSNVAKHLKKCCVKSNGEGEEEEGPSFRVGYLASDWDVAKGTLPSGQYCAVPCENFPEHFHKLVLNDPTEGESYIVDAYDAIWGTLFASSKQWKLIHTFHSIKEVLEEEWPQVDILVLGNWVYPTAFQDETNGKALALDMYHKLQELEVDRRLRIFPPLDYVWYFAQKVHYYHKLSMMRLPNSAFVIPTVPVPTEHFWKRKLQDFAKEQGVSELMLKRELSETSKHVLKAKASAIGALAGRASGFRWMAQPVLQEFCEEREFRMFVINSTCKWGVATRFVNDDETGVVLEKIACAPGRKSWDKGGGKEAATVAELVVEVVSQELACASKFLRVDMVKRKGGGWWINELEYFGNAFIHFESFDNAPDMLDQVVAGVTSWLEGFH